MSIQDRDWYRKAWQEKENNNNSTHNTNANVNNINKKIFYGKVLDTTSDKGKYYSRIVCGKCNSINTVEFTKSPKGTFEFTCINCKERVSAKINNYLIGDCIVIVALVLLYLFFR